MDRLRPFLFKNNTLKNLSPPYSTEIGILIDLLHLRSQRHPSELSFYFPLFVLFFIEVRLKVKGTSVP